MLPQPQRARVNRVRLSCPAKVNLALRVGRAASNGLHPIASWMIAVQFGDELVMRPADDGPSRFDIAFHRDAPVRQPVDWPLEKDLAFRAHALLEQHVGRPLPVELTLRKRIPARAGLGGGSSDAAAVLVGLNRLFTLDLSLNRLTRLAMQLGSDVAFLVSALTANPSAVVTGFGQTIESAPCERPIHLVLIFPPVTCDTAAVYRAFDLTAPNAPASPDKTQVHALARAPILQQDAPINDLKPAALHACPELSEKLAQVERAVDLPVHVTGSGSTLFVVGAGDTHAHQVSGRITERTGMPTIVTRTITTPPCQ